MDLQKAEFYKLSFFLKFPCFSIIAIIIFRLPNLLWNQERQAVCSGQLIKLRPVLPHSAVDTTQELPLQCGGLEQERSWPTC